jgi:hypothetical protein
MTSVQKADIGMFDEIHGLLEGFKNPRLGAEDWRRLFTHLWNKEDGAPGYVLVQDSRIVGFLGTIFSERSIGGQHEQFCNVTSWIVLPEYRREGVKLILPLLRLRGCTITNLSPSHSARQIFERLGFHYLDTEARIFYPHLFPSTRKNGSAVITDPDAIAQIVGSDDLKILEDHRPYQCGHVLLCDNANGKYCYCIYTTIIRKSLRFSHLQYISDPCVFLAMADAVGSRLFALRQSLFMKVDCRLLGNRAVPHSVRFKVTSPRMYRSETLKAGQIDNLYSELIILNI